MGEPKSDSRCQCGSSLFAKQELCATTPAGDGLSLGNSAVLLKCLNPDCKQEWIYPSGDRGPKTLIHVDKAYEWLEAEIERDWKNQQGTPYHQVKEEPVKEPACPIT